MSRYRIREKLQSRLKQQWFGGGVGALLAAVFGLILLPETTIDLGKRLRDWSYDLPFIFADSLRPAVNNENIRIIYLDEKSYGELKQSPGDFDRGLHAQLIRKLKADGAKMIVFDILFVDPRPGEETADKNLADAMRENGKVVLAAQYDELLHTPAIAYQVIPPLDLFRDVCAGWGLDKLDNESDSVPRRHYQGIEQVPSLAWKSAEIAGAGVTKNPNDRRIRRWLNYYSDHPFQGVSYSDALAGTSLPSGFFSNKMVFIGAGDEVAGYSAHEQKEHFRSPWTWLTRHFNVGVEVHALTFQNLMRQDWLSQTSPALEVVIVLFSGLVLGYGLCVLRPLAATGATCIFVVLMTLFSAAAFARFNVWFPWLIPVAVQVPIALSWSYLFNSVRAFVEGQLLETSLALYLSPKQVKQILKQPDLLKPGGREQLVTILFSDIASFSKISEGLDPNKLVNELNHYYEAAIGCVHKTDGTVMNLIGDAIFAIWNAPQEQPDHQERACRAALLLSEQVNRPDPANVHLPFRTRIGLHTGIVCVGNIGGSAHFNYTAIGESVNMASRLEGLNKQLGTNILLTRDIQKNVEGPIITRLVGHFRFKGFDKFTEVHELVSTREAMPSPEPWPVVFAESLKNFQRRSFAAAADGFRQTLALRPNDGPAKYYLERIAEFENQSLPEDWSGGIELHEK
jgi:adenylate cyclase